MVKNELHTEGTSLIKNWKVLKHVTFLSGLTIGGNKMTEIEADRKNVVPVEKIVKKGLESSMTSLFFHVATNFHFKDCTFF